jgi:D-arabinose 1-dehydrogenase-like Zn-dependent alcohol dehydrogenase
MAAAALTATRREELAPGMARVAVEACGSCHSKWSELSETAFGDAFDRL